MKACQIVNSAITPKEVASNAPHLVAVWEEFVRAPWPLTAIAQTLDYGTKVPVKVDIIARGGEEWIKVNTYVMSTIPKAIELTEDQDQGVSTVIRI